MSTPENWCGKLPEPPKDEPQSISVSSLCEMGWQPLLLTGFLRDDLIRHFTTPSEIEATDLRKYLWREDERTGILIESVFRWRGDVVEKRPAILIKRNAYQCEPIVLDDLTGEDEKSYQYEEYANLFIGSHTLFCIHGTGASVDILATECVRYLNGFAPIIRRYLSLAKFQVTEVGAISEVEEAREHYTVAITVGWAYTEEWRVQRESLPLRRISFQTLVDYVALDRNP